MQMRQRTSSHMHTAASETHTLTHIHTDAHRHYISTFSIYTRMCSISVVVRSCAHKHQNAVKSEIRLESHFLIIHKYSSLSVHECHVNEHGEGGEREGGEKEVERKKETHH